VKARALLFYRLLVRPMLAEPLRTALTVLAVALGVGVVVAIESAGRAAAGSFRSSLETVAGEADYEITAAGGLPEELLAKLARLPVPMSLAPRVEGSGRLAATGTPVRLVGMDLIAEAARAPVRGQELFEALREPHSIWCGRAVASRAGETVRVVIHDVAREYTVRGLIEGAGLDSTLILDIGAAQEALRKPGRLDRIEVRLPESASPDVEARLREALPEGILLRPAGARTEENRKMLAAFRWNLRVLSYIALIVGAFLIYNTIAISVLRRRAEIGLLRALGAMRGEVAAAFLTEGALFGALGAALGLLAGRLMAEGALRLMASTVDTLYATSSPAPLSFDAAIVGLAFAVGILVAVASALAPAIEAARVAPVEALARGRYHWERRLAVRRNLLGALALASAAGLASLGPPLGGKPVLGYLAAVLLIAAMALAMPALIDAVARLNLARLAGLETLIALRGLRASLGRSAVLAGALATAAAMVIAVGILIGSFRETVSLWLEQQLAADFYLQPAAATGAERDATLDPALAAELARLDEIAEVERFRAYDISFNGLPAYLAAVETDLARRWGKLRFLGGQDREAILERLGTGPYAIASEPFASKHGLRPGDILRLPLAGRAAEFELLGIYYDYSNERGYIVVDRDVLLGYLPDPAPTSLAVYLQAGADRTSARAAIERACAGREVRLISNRELREEALRIFDRTFAITWALEAIALAVAVIGMAGALLALVIDRRRELALLRFLGAAGTQIRRLLVAEAAALGLLALVAGSALGLLLALILIFVINKQSFGWTIQLHWPAGLLVAALGLVYLATLLAALYPARLAQRLNPIEVIHEE
jgi:putative ABC transport system permease protein